VFLDHVEPILLLPLVTHLPACINLTADFLSRLYLDTIGFGICVWVDLLSLGVMSHCTRLSSFVMLIWLVVYCVSCGHPSFVM
jgi:hypothetical protein